MSKLRVLDGQVFGRLTVLGLAGKNKSGNYKWKVRCECGTEKEVASDHLVRSIDPVASCGCLLVEKNRLGFDPDQTAFNLLFASYKKRARQKDRDFLLTVAEFTDLTKRDCEYCGQPPKTVAFNGSKRGRYVHNGVDRVDPLIGYVPDNCVPCCKLCNYMKLALSKDEFLSHVAQIADFQGALNNA
jgi:hypothetical protein